MHTNINSRNSRDLVFSGPNGLFIYQAYNGVLNCLYNLMLLTVFVWWELLSLELMSRARFTYSDETEDELYVLCKCTMYNW